MTRKNQMTRKNKIALLLKKNHKGLSLRQIANALTDDEKSSWSNYINTYKCLRNHSECFERVRYGLYKYNDQPEFLPDFEADSATDIAASVFAKDEYLRASEVWHRVRNSGTAISYSTLFEAMNRTDSPFLKYGLFYSYLGE